MIVEILSIGTELLLGDVVDTNSAYLAQELTAAGFDIHYMTTVGDNFNRIVQAFERALTRSDIIITTGGLGPTDDDLTREAIARATDRSLEKKESLVKEIKNYFQHKHYKMTENNYKQAYLPRGAKPINNQKGTAPGVILEHGDKIIISMPGVPREMKFMFREEVIPYLKNLNEDRIKSKVLKFFSIGESSLETEIKDILDAQTNPTLALLAGTGEVKIRITAKGRKEGDVDRLINKTVDQIKDRVGKYIYSTDDQDLAEVVAELLAKKDLTLSVAESCTGGLIGKRITDIPGSSKFFYGGITAYSNQVKINQLGVCRETIEDYGAVSSETAAEMASGIRQKMGTDFGLAVTGIAGPGGGTAEKPVGLIYLGLASEDETKTFKLNLHGDRDWNRWMSSQYCFYYLYKYLTGR